VKNRSSRHRLFIILLFVHFVGIAALIVWSCTQQPSITHLDRERGVDQHRGSAIDLHIDNRINRGADYTDAQGNKYNLRYIPVVITNDGLLPTDFQLDFLERYSYPSQHGDETFKVIPLPREWALDGVGVTDSMMQALPKHINNPSIKETLAPGDELVIAIGTLYPMSTKYSGVLPNTLFLNSEDGLFPACRWLTIEAQPSGPQVSLGLKLVFGDRCAIIRCGQITNPAR